MSKRRTIAASVIAAQRCGMEMKISVDTESLSRFVAEVIRQAPYAANNAIARTAQEAAEAAQREARSHLQIRKDFLLKRMRVLKYPRANDLTAVIGVDENVQGSPLIIGLLEQGQSGDKTGSSGAGVAVPLTGSPARPEFAAKVTPRLLYKKLQMERHTTSGGFTQWKGKQRTFVIPGVGVFQRVGRKPKTARRGKSFASGGASSHESSRSVLIYKFDDRVRLGAHVRLREAMIAKIRERWNAIFSEEFAKEIRSRASHLAG